VALAEKVPGIAHIANKRPPMRRSKNTTKRILIRLNMGGAYGVVYLFGDFYHKSHLPKRKVSCRSLVGGERI